MHEQLITSINYPKLIETQANQPTFGFDKKLIIDKEPAGIVKKIFEMRSQGMTYDAIAQYLNDKKILVPRLYFKYDKLRDDGTIQEMNMWTRTILNKMINNEHYTGKLIFGR